MGQLVSEVLGSLYRHIMEMEQMMARLLAEMKAQTRTNQAKVDASLNKMKEEMTARLEAMIQKNQERMETNQEKMMDKLDDHHERMMARMDFQVEKMEAVVDVFKERLTRQTIALEVIKLAARSSVRIRKMDVKASPKQKKRLRAIGVGASTFIGTFSLTDQKKNDGGTPGLAHTLSGSRSGRAALRREQREKLQSNHHEN
jgi:rubrerythrin